MIEKEEKERNNREIVLHPLYCVLSTRINQSGRCYLFIRRSINETSVIHASQCFKHLRFLIDILIERKDTRRGWILLEPGCN